MLIQLPSFKLLQHYQATESEDLKEECSTLERIVKKELSSEGTLFTCPPYNYRVNSWKENACMRIKSTCVEMAEGLLRDNPEVRPLVLSNARLTSTTIHAGAYGNVVEVAVSGAV